MSFNYYYRGYDEEEVTIQVTGNTAKPLSIRVAEDDDQTTAVINLPLEEIDGIIAGLQEAKQKILSRHPIDQ